MSGVLRGLRFEHTHVDPDVWIHDGGEVQEYIIVYMDDIITAMKDPHAFFDKLQGPEVGFKMKGIGAPTYHLGADFFCDDGRTLFLGAPYSKQLVANFK